MQHYSGLPLAVWLVLVPPVVSQEVPSRGSVTSVEQNSSLTFECRDRSARASCSFVQTLVTQEKPFTSQQVEAYVAEILADDSLASSCGEVLEQLAIVIDGGDFGVALTPRDRADAREYADALGRFCSERGSDAATALVDHMEQRKSRTCKIGTLSFDLTFTWNGSSGRWETVSAPEGGCGIVTMSFMERDKESAYFWNYREQTIVTNKAGTDPIRGECAAWPEEELVYQWQPDTLKRSCEYISFGF